MVGKVTWQLESVHKMRIESAAKKPPRMKRDQRLNKKNEQVGY